MMHQRISKKIIIYLFIFFILVTVTNRNLSNNFYLIKKFNINGLNPIETEKISHDLKIFENINIFLFDKKDISEKIYSNKIVEKLNVFKNYPSTLNIEIKKTKFLAMTKKDNSNYLIGANGNLIKIESTNFDLPFIFGKPDIIDFLNFKKKIDQSNFSYEEIKNLYFYPSKRWDLELKNNIFVKLPKDNVKESLNLSYQFLNEKNLHNINLIDTRIKNQVVVK